MSQAGSTRSKRRPEDRAFGTQAKSPRRMDSQASSAASSQSEVYAVAGQLVRVELENFMCHGNLKVEFDIRNNNCFYIGGPNGSGKSALFSAINIGLGGGGRSNDRGNCVKQYIKNGKNSAKIKITLANVGQGRCEKYRKEMEYEDYGNYIIVERNITQASSTYSIKTTKQDGRDRKEYLVSHKKTDLDIILARFGIELANPIYWLSQDKARSFLSQTDPKKMFQIFMDASELDKTKEEYRQAEVILHKVHDNIECIHKQLINERKEFNKMKEQLDKKQKEKDVLNEVQRLQWLSHHAPLRDARHKKKVMEEKLKKTDEKITQLKEEQNRNALQIQESRKALGDLAENTAINKKEGDQRREFLQDLNGEIEPLKLECKHLEGDVRRHEGDIENAEKEIHVAHRKIQDQERRMNSNEDRQNLDKYQKAIQELEQMQKDQKANREKIEEEKKDIENELKEAHRNALNANQQTKATSSEYRGLQDDLRVIEQTEKDLLLRFGQDAPTIARIIEANANRFSQRPKGPIGSYIKVYDRKYLLAVEAALRNNLQTYLFDNYGDEQTFKQLLEQQRIRTPQTVIAKFGLPPHRTQGNEPKGYLTILKAIDVTDNDVRNLLIDLQNIESTILFDSDQEARDVMNGNLPDMARLGYSVTGAQVYGRNRSGGNYRFYACHKPRPKFLSDLSRDNKEALRRQMELAQRKYEIAAQEERTVRAKFDALKERYERLDVQQKSIEEGLKKRKGQITNYSRQIERIKESDDGDTVIQAQERLVEEYQDMIRTSNNKIVEIGALLEKKKKQLKKLVERREAFQAESTAILERFQATENEAVELKKKIDDYTEKNNRCDRYMKKMEETKDMILEDERVSILKLIDEAEDNLNNYDGEVPLGPDGNPEVPDYDDMPATEDIFDWLKKKTVELGALHQALDIIPTVEEMQKRKDDFNYAKTLFQKCRGLHTQIKDCLEIRQKKFPVIQHAIIMKLKQEFTRLIKFKFTGDLRVDVKSGEIKIKVRPHAETSQDSLKDIRGLSGGERSYTTTCFFMALWYIAETPFRCMDEFDVFMDGHMRKTAMDLIVKLATESYSHQQFIFFTPQGINELSTGDRVATFEMPKVRDN